MSIPHVSPQRLAVKIKEHDTQRTIMGWLNVYGIFFWRNNTGVKIREATETQNRGFIRFGTPGAPDLFAIHAGKVYGIECKSPTGKQTEKQKAFEQSFSGAGRGTCVYILARSLEDVTEAISLVARP